MDLAKNVIFNQLQGSPMYSKSNSTSFFVKKMVALMVEKSHFSEFFA